MRQLSLCFIVNFCQSFITSCNFKKYGFFKHIDINTLIDRSSNKRNCLGRRKRGPDSRATESRSVENKEFEKHGVWWKTGGFSGKHGV